MIDPSTEHIRKTLKLSGISILPDKAYDAILEKERRALDKLEAIKTGYQASDSEH